MTRRAPLAAGREHTGDPQTDEIWRRLREVADVVNGSPFGSGRLITEEEGGLLGSGLAFTASTARSIPHKLGRKARGFVEVYGADVPSAGHCRLRATAHQNGVTSATHISLTASTTGTCFVWVF